MNTMQKIGLIILSIVVVIWGVGYYIGTQNKKSVKEEETKYSQIFEKVDYFVEQLNTTYDHYDAYGKYAETVYLDTTRVTITPCMRLICLTFGKYDCDAYKWVDEIEILRERIHYSMEYEELVRELNEHYKDDTRINKIFINGNNYVTIDCRY